LELGTFLGPLSSGAEESVIYLKTWCVGRQLYFLSFHSIGDSFNTGAHGAHNGQAFSTIDADHDNNNADNDNNCAELYTGAWW
jgi:hypothetical protein